MDTFFATMKGGESSRGHTCCQLFVTDKGFIYTVPMKKNSEVLLAIKQFAKEIGAPDSFVADMSGITVLRGEPGSTTLQLRMHSSFMDPLPTQLPLVMKVTSQTCVSVDGMDGVTSGINQQHSPTTRKFWEEYLALPEELAMRWPNGYSRRMAELSLEDPSDPSKLMNFIVLWKSRKEKYFINSLRGDGEHQ